jgi:hypothetical protein
MINRHIKTSAAVVAAGALFAAGGMASATAKNLITGDDIADNTVTAKNLAANSVGRAELRDGVVKDGKDGKTGPMGPQGPAGESGSAGAEGVRGLQGADGATGATGATGPAGPAGPQGIPGTPGRNGTDGVNGHDATYVGPNWSLMDRNIIGDGFAYLRSGPGLLPDGLGIGSLGLHTGNNTSKAAFGNEIDFRGQALPSQIGFWAYTTDENISQGASWGNMPSIQFEIDPNVSASSTNYATLIYVPANTPAGQWTQIDADADSGDHWALTRDLDPTGTNCYTSGSYCTFDEVMGLLNDGDAAASVLSVSITHGRDFAFTGAADGLRLDGTTYDFEPFGVYARN